MLTEHLNGLMPYARCRLGRIKGDKRAVTAIEYALIAVIIVLAIMGGLGIIGGNLAIIFNDVSSEL
ncbi:Flp family type IVb pilin [Acidocella sp.]|uniref:Flp family type IVb pilin n=1 Tax=Acidocella sp. TaxID=50710 RepID=UPI00260CC768|nr:Flp family type IVb pilin [Acidocella sp.]